MLHVSMEITKLQKETDLKFVSLSATDCKIFLPEGKGNNQFAKRNIIQNHITKS